MAAVTHEQDAWVSRVLGFDLSATAAAAARAPATEPVLPAAPSPRVAFTQSRLAWDATRKQVRAELKRLEDTILAECQDEPDFATIAANAGVLYTITEFLDERLIDKLDEALNAQEPAERIARQNEAREIIDEYIDYMAGDELLRDVDDNGFTDLQIRNTVSAQLRTISDTLKTLAA